MRDRGEVLSRVDTTEERDGHIHRAEDGRVDVGVGGPGVKSTRPGPLARLAAKRRVVSADLARIAAAMRLAARHEE